MADAAFSEVQKTGFAKHLFDGVTMTFSYAIKMRVQRKSAGVTGGVFEQIRAVCHNGKKIN